MSMLFRRGAMASAALLTTLAMATVAYSQQNPAVRPQQNAGQIGQGQVNPTQPQFNQGQINQRQFNQGPVNPAQANQGQISQADRDIAIMLMLGNHGEVAMNKFAQERAQNADVKKFANEMVEQHTAFMNQLRPFTGGWMPSDQQPGAAAPQPGQAPQQPGQPGQAQFAQQQHQPGQMAGRFDWVRFKQDVCNHHLASVERKLESKPRSELDKCFMGSQVMAHQQMLDELQVAKNYVSPQFQQVIEQGIQTTQRHLEHAEHLMAELHKTAGKQTAQQPGEATTR